jgi:Chaperone of endosialidase
MKTRIPTLLITCAFVCLGLVQNTQAVSPAPDGGYPGGNTAEGQNALLSLTTGGFNTAVGFLSLRSNSTGQFNTAIGAGALLANTANDNTATGAGALLSDTTGAVNTAIGTSALVSNTIGGANTANGAFALSNNTSGSNNTADGDAALLNNTIGSHNNALGYFAGVNVITASGVICIGADGANVNNTTWIGNIYNTTTVSGTTLPVIVSDGGQLGTTPSSRRFKKEIKPMESASEAILALKPVTFHYKSDKTNTPQFGLIAEEVAKVNPDLIVRDKNRDVYTVRYDAVNAMLLNEFLKEHRKVEEQEASITQLKSTVTKQEATIAQQRKDFEVQTAQQQKEIQALTASLTKQAAQIQEVSAQLEASKARPQVVNNP